MKPIKTPNSNLIYRGPTPDIGDLPCERVRIEGGPQHGGSVIYSMWELSDEEREIVARGGNIKLGIYAEPIPPVSLEIVHEGREESYGEEEFEYEDDEEGPPF